MASLLHNVTHFIFFTKQELGGREPTGKGMPVLRRHNASLFKSLTSLNSLIEVNTEARRQKCNESGEQP
jgi:hypothetical protein